MKGKASRGSAKSKSAGGPASKSASSPSSNGNRTRPRIADAVRSASKSDLVEMLRFWGGHGPGQVTPASLDEQRELVAGWMADAGVVEARVEGLGRRMGQVFGMHLNARQYRLSVEQLSGRKPLANLSEYDLEATLSMLRRQGLLVETEDKKATSFGGRAHAVPLEIGDAVHQRRRAKRRGVFDVLTLRGHLDRLYDDPSRRRRTPPTRLREMYKMYSSETACIARIERLEEDLRALVEKAVLQFGGILPRGLYERMDTGEQRWSAQRWRNALESSLVGTIERLDLARYGIQQGEDCLIVFNEVALAWLRRMAVPGDPDQPDHESSLGVDLAANISRFIGFILEHNVRFTIRGEIFKTTEKRIIQELIPNPGRENSREAVLDFIYEFTRAASLIESTGERTFSLSAEGRSWEQKELEEKLRALLEFSVEERGVAGDFYHQVRMRRLFLRLLKRIEPGVWYDLMYLPFLVRNTYLSSIDEGQAEAYFQQRGQGNNASPMEDPQRLAWNLAKWVRSRIYLLGLIDLGYDAADRPVAMRLTRLGARLVGSVEGEANAGPSVGSLIVTPDFEVVLFPTGDDAELVHELDRFCEREKAGETLHFRIVERSVHRALSEGMSLSRIVETLRGQSRTPVPQNVLFSIRDWSHRAGLLRLDENGVVRCEDPDTFARFRQDPGVRPYLREVLDEKSAQLKRRFSPRRMQSLLRELEYLVELE